MLKRLYETAACTPDGAIGSYWETTAPTMAGDFVRLSGDQTCDVAIIGSGFTGLSAALRLAGHHGRDVVVVDAGYPGWGASGRNGGFCCVGGDKLSDAAMRRRYGDAETSKYRHAQFEAIDLVADLLKTHAIDADAEHGGELQLAHKAGRLGALQEEADAVRREFGFDARVFDRAGLEAFGASGPEFHGGILFPKGFGLNPMKYVQGLARAAAAAGARIFAHSPVERLDLEDGRHRLEVPGGSITARSVIVATNGYSSENVPREFAGRLLPVLSNILVTRPLSDGELAAQGWSTSIMSFDTRNLLHYFRLLPDRRFLFGGRGGTDAGIGAQASMHALLRHDFERMFPAWSGVEDTHFWSGLACLSYRRVPCIGTIGSHKSAWAGLAYHGNGVSMGTWTGRRLGDLAAGSSSLEEVPAVMRGAPVRFPFPALRLTYLKAAYAYYGLHDEWR